MSGSFRRTPCGPCSQTTVGPCPARCTTTLRPPNSVSVSLCNMARLRARGALFSGDAERRRPADLGQRILRPPLVLELVEAVAQLRHHLAREARGVVEHGLVLHVAEVQQ